MYILICVGVPNLRSISITNSTITVQWDSVIPSDCGPILYYTVTAVISADASDRNTMEKRQTTAEFSNLRNGTSYNISVAAVNRVDTGPSSVITVNTLTGNEAG